MEPLGLGKLIALVCLVALAGFIDSIAGGGGLVSLTSFYAFGLPPVFALGTNKFCMTFGTFFATINFAKNKKIVWKIALSSIIFCLLGSSLGAQIALRYADTILRYVLLIVLPFLTFMTIRKKDNKEGNLIKSVGEVFQIPAKVYLIIWVMAFFIGIYDGFFGPGTGSFYVILFSFLGLPMIYASGTTKVLNLASNLAAFTTFIINGNINYLVGIPCIFASITGNLIGSTYAIKKDTKIVKKVLIVVIVLLYLKIVTEFFI